MDITPDERMRAMVERHERLLRGENGMTPGLIQHVREIGAKLGEVQESCTNLAEEATRERKAQERRDERRGKLIAWLIPLAGSGILAIVNFIINILQTLALGS